MVNFEVFTILSHRMIRINLILAVNTGSVHQVHGKS